MAAAIHNGHDIRPELLPYINLTEKQRRREEDPYTGDLLKVFGSSLLLSTSRFEVDINRPRDKAVYLVPEDAWGLPLYHSEIPEDLIKISLCYYDKFYEQLYQTIKEELIKKDFLVVYDLHSYNHRRNDIDVFADPETNPEVNLGTGNVGSRWRPVIDELIACISDHNYRGRSLDVRENVKFRGGHFTRWLNETFGEQVCPIAIEFKKFFMNEWTGKIYTGHLQSLRHLLVSTVHPICEKASML